MPWSQKQYRTAQAVMAGATLKGLSKGFTPEFAAQVIAEGVKKQKRKMKPR